MHSPNEQSRRISARLRQAYELHGFEPSSKSFAMEMSSLYGDESSAIVGFFHDQCDLPLGTILRLCNAVAAPISQIFSNTDDRDHLQIYDYLGSNPCHVYLPRSLAWDRKLLRERLFYLPAPEDSCIGLLKDDLIVMTRRTTTPVIGEVFAIETESEILLRRCGEINTDQAAVRFVKFDGSPSPQDFVFPIGKETTNNGANGIAVLTGRMVCSIHA